MKRMTVIVCLLLAICGCATIDSESASDRMIALSKITDQSELGKCVVTAQYFDVKEGALDRITNTTILVSIALNRGIEDKLKDSAALKLYNEDDIVSLLSQSAVSENVARELGLRVKTQEGFAKCIRGPLSEKVKKQLVNGLTSAPIIVSIATDIDLAQIIRDCAAIKIKDEMHSLLILEKSTVSESVAMSLVGNVVGENNLLSICENEKLPLDVRMSSLKRLKSDDSILSISTNESLRNELRIAALRRVKRDSDSLAKAFVQCASIDVAHAALLLMDPLVINSQKVQECLNKWCLTLSENQGDAGNLFLRDILARIQSQQMLWCVINNDQLPCDIRKISVCRLTDMKQVCEIIIKDRYEDSLRKSAVEKLKDNPEDLEKCLNDIKSADIGIAIAKSLPAEKIQQDKIQKRLVEWFVESNDQNVIASVLDLLGDDVELGKNEQRKLLHLATATNAECIRNAGSRFLTDPMLVNDAILNTTNDEQYMLWLSTLISSDIYREQILNKLNNSTVRGVIVSQLSSQDRILRVAKTDSDDLIRIIAIKHLSQVSTDGLKSLIEDKDDAISLCAFERLKQVNATAARDLQSVIDSRAELNRKKMAELRKEEASRDWKRAKADVAAVVKVLTTTHKQIMDLQNCAMIASKKGCAPRFRAVLSGTVVSVDDGWLSKEFVIQASGKGNSLTCRCEPISGIPNGVCKGATVTVIGTFKSGTGNSVTLENVALK